MAYARDHRYVHVAGGLLAAESDKSDLLTDIVAWADRERLVLSFYNLTDSDVSLVGQFGFQVTKWGEEALVDLSECDWLCRTPPNASQTAQSGNRSVVIAAPLSKPDREVIAAPLSKPDRELAPTDRTGRRGPRSRPILLVHLAGSRRTLPTCGGAGALGNACPPDSVVGPGLVGNSARGTGGAERGSFCRWLAVLGGALPHRGLRVRVSALRTLEGVAIAARR